MTDYAENVSYLNDQYFASEGVKLVEIKNKFSEFNLFYKYLIQK